MSLQFVRVVLGLQSTPIIKFIKNLGNSSGVLVIDFIKHAFFKKVQPIRLCC